MSRTKIGQTNLKLTSVARTEPSLLTLVEVVGSPVTLQFVCSSHWLMIGTFGRGCLDYSLVWFLGEWYKSEEVADWVKFMHPSCRLTFVSILHSKITYYIVLIEISSETRLKIRSGTERSVWSLSLLG